ncbi:uncharacterized protein LOC112549196 [Alligator sinensis]|uniref:Uncharacterized protein LOC112549196 n=1 Tax=Alligator sinensis TaxID=38654 RepID=A0A3Q0G246_ALLSI|nr:uncharacterized protein LOC112549196 [Alligator sinensis]
MLNKRHPRRSASAGLSRDPAGCREGTAGPAAGETPGAARCGDNWLGHTAGQGRRAGQGRAVAGFVWMPDPASIPVPVSGLGTHPRLHDIQRVQRSWVQDAGRRRHPHLCWTGLEQLMRVSQALYGWQGSSPRSRGAWAEDQSPSGHCYRALARVSLAPAHLGCYASLTRGHLTGHLAQRAQCPQPWIPARCDPGSQAGFGQQLPPEASSVAARDKGPCRGCSSPSAPPEPSWVLGPAHTAGTRASWRRHPSAGQGDSSVAPWKRVKTRAAEQRQAQLGLVWQGARQTASGTRAGPRVCCWGLEPDWPGRWSLRPSLDQIPRGTRCLLTPASPSSPRLLALHIILAPGRRRAELEMEQELQGRAPGHRSQQGGVCCLRGCRCSERGGQACMQAARSPGAGAASLLHAN